MRWGGPALAAAAVLAVGAGGYLVGRLAPPRPAPVEPAPVKTAKPFAPPPDSALPDDAFGKEAALGREIFVHTRAAAPGFVGDDLTCENCHLDAGRLARSAPMWGAFVRFPQYRAKDGHVVTFQERMQGCFRFSMNGKAPPLGGRVLVALESWAAFLARGAPMGAKLPGAGYPKLAAPPLAPDPVRGRAVFEGFCAFCHGADGGGRKSGGETVFPPLWGPRAYNWGAGMADVDKAAGFIQANMPFSQGRRLTAQQAWDVAAYIDSRPRPQDPRFTGSSARTRARFHDTRWSYYGRTIDGVRLGAAPRS